MRATAQATRRLFRLGRDERGTQLVELAIVMPLLIVMFGAVAEFGRFFYTYTTLAKATRAGARYMVTRKMNGPEGEAAQRGAKNLVVCGDPEVETCDDADAVIEGLKDSHVQIVPTGGTPGSPLTVTIRIEAFEYEPLFDLGRLVGSDTLSLKIDVEPSTTMRYLLMT
jgi:Flp pilus assembly protein TadG